MVKKCSNLLLCFALLLLFSCTKQAHTTKAGNTNIQLVRTYWEEVWNKGNLQGVEDFYHPQAIHGENFSIAGFQKGVASQRAAFPDFKVRIDDIFATGSRVICRVTYTGIHTGKKMFGQEPLGKAIEVPGIDIFTLKDGKCVEHQHVADHLDMVLQMGLTLTPAQEAAALEQKGPPLEQLNGYDRPVYYSRGADANRVAEIAGLTQRATPYFQQLLKTSPSTPLYILTPADWAQHSAHPTYGMANYQNGKLVVASDDNDFFRSFLPPLDQLPPPVAAQVMKAYGRKDGSTSMQPFFDLLALHELGHAYHNAGQLNMQRKWMGELFANLMLHTYVAEKDKALLPALETFPQMVVAAGKAEYKHTSLADFERLYDGVGDKNYGWYQSWLHMGAKQIYDAAGPGALQMLWAAMQKNQQNLTDE